MTKFGIVLAGIVSAPCIAAGPSPGEIVRRSVAMMEQNWKRAPDYGFTEQNVQTNGNSRTVNTYRVLMIDGSPFYRQVGANGRALTPEQETAEARKLECEIANRKKEPADVRSRRIAQYEKGRTENQALMREMADGFEYRLVGEQTVAGRRAWVLAAEPREGYRPKTPQTRVLTGMRGKLWIDQQQCQWVKVEAEVFRPVAFGVFVAKVRPGTKFLLEQAPVAGDLWLPSHFSVRVNTTVLWWDRHSSEEATYSDYRPAGETTALRSAATR